ncbi:MULTISPECIES: hypothetical protein [Streptomyces]|uniref:hypothetical protein n=1 Tax=Streptomyces herbicida TaxID=3065675 RepID=UPI0038CD509E
MAALRAGAWVWCEKPPVPTPADFDAVEAEEGAAGGPYAAIVFRHRFGSGSRHVRRPPGAARGLRPRDACRLPWGRRRARTAPARRMVRASATRRPRGEELDRLARGDVSRLAGAVVRAERPSVYGKFGMCGRLDVYPQGS